MVPSSRREGYFAGASRQTPCRPDPGRPEAEGRDGTRAICSLSYWNVHVGGARSALHNWVFANQAGGTFVLRIEDTDAARNAPEWTEGILSALDWIGISAG